MAGGTFEGGHELNALGIHGGCMKCRGGRGE